MRSEPFEASSPSSSAPGEAWRDHTIDLRSHLKRPARDNTAAGATQSAGQQQTAEEHKETNERKPGAGTFDEPEPGAGQSQFEEMVKTWEDENDPVALSKILIQIGNVGRVFFVPGMYFKLVYPGQEAYDLKNVIDKSIQNEKDNKKPDDGFNNYEKRLFEKLPKLREAQANVSYTQIEMDEAAKFLARAIRNMTVAVFLSRYMWIIFLLYLEFKHAQPLIEQKGADFFNAKFPNINMN